MNKFFKGKSLLVVGGVFVLVILGLIIVIVNIGKAYRGGLSFFGQNQPETSVSSQKKKNIKKITIQKTGTEECFEVTPDGVVRVFATCDGELTQAARLSDPRYILDLFKRISEGTLPAPKVGDTVYTLTIETDEGSETIQIVIDDDTEDIIEIIDNIIEDIPDPSPTLAPSGSSFFFPSPQTSASPGSSAGPQPSDVPQSSATADQPFSCNFAEGGQNKPYRVSNIVCSDEPQP